MKAYGKSWSYNVYCCRYCLYWKGKRKGCTYEDGCCCPVPQKPARRNSVEIHYETVVAEKLPVSECTDCPYSGQKCRYTLTFQNLGNQYLQSAMNCVYGTWKPARLYALPATVSRQAVCPVQVPHRHSLYSTCRYRRSPSGCVNGIPPLRHRYLWRSKAEATSFLWMVTQHITKSMCSTGQLTASGMRPPMCLM